VELRESAAAAQQTRHVLSANGQWISPWFCLLSIPNGKASGRANLTQCVKNLSELQGFRPELLQRSEVLSQKNGLSLARIATPISFASRANLRHSQGVTLR